MKIIKLDEIKDVKDSGLVGTSTVVGITKKIKLFKFMIKESFDKIPENGIYTILLYKKDSFSDTTIGVERYTNCETLKRYDSTECIDISYENQEFFNMDEIKQIRSSRIDLVFQNLKKK